MEITWYGLGCFRLNERSYPAIVTDPFYDQEDTGYELPHRKTEIITLSQQVEDLDAVHWKGMRGKPHIFDTPGEYEVGGVFITGLPTYRDNKRGKKRGENTIYTYHVNGLALCHLGDLGHVPTQSQIEAIGPVHVLLIPVGIPDGLTISMASEIISLTEPNVIIPMDYATPDLKLKRNSPGRFLKEMGISSQEKGEESVTISSSSIPDETEIILLEPKKD